jgi:hypothetical protein
LRQEAFFENRKLLTTKMIEPRTWFALPRQPQTSVLPPHPDAIDSAI